MRTPCAQADGSEFLFQLLDVLCERRLSDVDLSYRANHMECLRDDAEVTGMAILDHLRSSHSHGP